MARRKHLAGPELLLSILCTDQIFLIVDKLTSRTRTRSRRRSWSRRCTRCRGRRGTPARTRRSSRASPPGRMCSNSTSAAARSSRRSWRTCTSPAGPEAESNRPFVCAQARRCAIPGIAAHVSHLPRSCACALCNSTSRHRIACSSPPQTLCFRAVQQYLLTLHCFFLTSPGPGRRRLPPPPRAAAVRAAMVSAAATALANDRRTPSVLPPCCCTPAPATSRPAACALHTGAPVTSSRGFTLVHLCTVW